LEIPDTNNVLVQPQPDRYPLGNSVMVKVMDRANPYQSPRLTSTKRTALFAGHMVVEIDSGCAMYCADAFLLLAPV
jgi:hypothetical protein